MHKNTRMAESRHCKSPGITVEVWNGSVELSPGMEVWKGYMDQTEISMGPGASVCLCLSFIHTLMALFHKSMELWAVTLTLWWW